MNTVHAPLVNQSHTLDGAGTNISSGSWPLFKVLQDGWWQRTAASPRLAWPTWRSPTDESDAQVSRPGDLQVGRALCPWPAIHTWLLSMDDTKINLS